MFPIELPATEASTDRTTEKETNAPPKTRYTLHAPSSPPEINTAYGEVAEGNPYADDDSLATPTPTQEQRNGMGFDGAAYIGGYFPPANRGPQAGPGGAF